MDVIEDEKKPFDAENGDEEDAQPDPDEHLMLEQGNGRVWMVKIPKHLLERWTSIDAEDVHLATIRVYHEALHPGTQKPRIVLFLPPHRNNNPIAPGSNNPSAANSPHSSQIASQGGTPPIYPSQSQSQASSQDRPIFGPNALHPAPDADGPDCYELEMVNDSVENQLVVAERPKDPSLSISSVTTAATVNTRARTTILTGRIKHECNLKPAFTPSYRRQMRERHMKANTKLRQIQMIEDAGVPGGRGGVNRLSSGVGVGAGGAFSDLIKTKPKHAKGAFERMARMPRNQLLDQIFVHFRESPRWAIRALREKTQQPEAYLKEVMSEVAFLHRSGEHNGLWELKDNFKDPDMKAENVPGPSLSQGDVKMEIDEDYDEDDDEDDDMEEVS